MNLPDELSGLFRNYVFETIDDEKHATLVIKTVLSRSTWEQVTWLFQRYGRMKVGEVFREDYFGLRNLPEPTRRLWELLFVDEAQWQAPDDESKWRCRRLANISEPPAPPSGYRNPGAC